MDWLDIHQMILSSKCIRCGVLSRYSAYAPWFMCELHASEMADKLKSLKGLL